MTKFQTPKKFNIGKECQEVVQRYSLAPFQLKTDLLSLEKPAEQSSEVVVCQEWM
jgi:hypothetical protein